MHPRGPESPEWGGDRLSPACEHAACCAMCLRAGAPAETARGGAHGRERQALRMAMVLTVAGLDNPTDAGEQAEPKKVFSELCSKYRINLMVSEHLVQVEGLETLVDFCEFFTAADQVEARLVGKIKDLPHVGLNASRIRQAWQACVDARATGSLRRKRDSSELDGLLEDGALGSLREAFHRRYKLQFGAQVEPSDGLVSRIYREIDNKLLHVHDVFKTKTLTHTFMAKRQKQRLGNGVDLLLPEADEKGEEEVSVKQSVGSYITLLFSLMLAYARAGCRPPADVPDQPEGMGSDSTRYVEVPLDTVLKYHGRAQNRAAQLPSHAALEWVRERDLAERTMWVEQHRVTGKSLGTIIRETYDRREAQWDLPQDLASPRPGGKGAKRPGGATPETGARKPGAGQASLVPGELALHFKDGTELCMSYNKGKCTNHKCTRLHVCNKVLKNGRVCGMKNHTAANCKGK